MNRNDFTQSLFRTHSLEDQEQLNIIKSIMPGIALSFGPNSLVSLHTTEFPNLPCIAVENGHINNLTIGSPASGFVRDAIIEEEKPSGRDIVGP